MNWDLLPLTHSWPIWELERQFELGRIVDCSAAEIGCSLGRQALMPIAVGTWECELGCNELTWSSEVYDMFGFPRGVPLARSETVARYCEDSRIKMERLRAYAIKHRRGFTLDAQIIAGEGRRRWIRLVGAPVCRNERVVRLQGLKLAA